MLDHHEPACEGVVIKKSGDRVYCGTTKNLKMNEELRHFCPTHFYEPTEPTEAPPYNPEEYGGYILAEEK